MRFKRSPPGRSEASAEATFTERLQQVDEVIADPLRFKAKLAIGEDAYKLLRMKNKVSQVIDTAGAVGTGMGIAKSAIVAETFFASSSFWSFLGVGATATTPIGWVIAAGAASGIAWHTLSKKSKEVSDARVTTIPKFINTPIDALGLSLFSLIAPLALKVAQADQEIDNLERDRIYHYLCNEWGFSGPFLRVGLSEVEAQLDQFEVKTISQRIAAFTKENPDCNPEKIREDLLQLLREVMQADGVVEPHEEQWIAKIEEWLSKYERKRSLRDLL